MRSPWLPAWMLLASLIVLYWTTSSASSEPSGKVKGGVLLESKAQMKKSLKTATTSLALMQEVMETFASENFKDKLKSLSTFASLAPGVGSMLSSIINNVMFLIPQDDPLLDEVKERFDEVNRQLDSLSIQIRNLETGVQLFNYGIVYSQDEVRILNAWRRFEEFFNEQGLDDFKNLIEIFANYYEYTQTEASVTNIYHHLEASPTSLRGNIYNLLIGKFKCDLNQIIKYNMYFSTLLWKGTVLNEVYWKLTGFNMMGREAKQAQMFKNIYEAQWAVVELCQSNSQTYVRGDVEEIAKQHSHKTTEEKEAIAKDVKTTLDKKYNWCNWVVLVYEKAKEDGEYIFVYDMIKIPIGDDIIVAVNYTLKADPAIEEKIESDVKILVENSFQKQQECNFNLNVSNDAGISHRGMMQSTDYIRATHAIYKTSEHVALPPPLYQSACIIKGYVYQVCVYNSIKLPVCKQNPCKNSGQCKQLLNSNEWLCVCQDGYHGDTCDKKMTIALPQKAYHLPVNTTTKARLNIIESKLDSIMKMCWGGGQLSAER